MKKRKGFTTVEILLVLGIIGIISAMMFNMVGRSNTQRSRFNRALNNFVGDFNFMKSKASAESRYVALVFNPNGKQYTIQVQDRIGDYGSWTAMPNRDGYVVMYGEPMFDPANVQSFAVNSMGQVFKMPVTFNDSPESVELEFFVKKRNTELVDYLADVKLYAYGGIRSEKKAVGGEEID